MKKKKIRRSVWEHFVITVSVVVIVALMAGGFAIRFISLEVNSLNRISLSATLTEKESATEPFNILIIGVDNAEGLDDGDPVLIGRNTSSLLTDSMMLVRVDPQKGSVALTSIPRDLWVSIGGSGVMEKINAALSLGGPTALLDTIQNELGVPVNHYVQVNFSGFKTFVEKLGGVPLSFAAPVKDEKTGFVIAEPGCWVLDGAQALALVRSRSLEVFVDGQWLTDPTGDVGRTTRQQRFVEAILVRAVNKGARNPFELKGMVDSVKDQLIFDDQLSIGDMLGTATLFQDFTISQLVKLPLPSTPGWVGQASVLSLTPEAEPILDVFRGVAPIPVPEPVRVEIQSGTVDPLSDVLQPTNTPATVETNENWFLPSLPSPDEACQ